MHKGQAAAFVPDHRNSVRLSWAPESVRFAEAHGNLAEVVQRL
jgi:hypothetical protein